MQQEDKEKKDEIEKELDEFLNSEDLSPEEAEELKKMFKAIKEGLPSISPKKKALKVLTGFIWRFILMFIINTACLGFFYNHYSFSRWYNIFIYTASLSAFSLIIRYIILLSHKITFNPIKTMVIRYVVVIIAMVVFNLLPHSFLVFDSFIYVIFYAVISIVLVNVLTMYIYKILFR